MIQKGQALVFYALLIPLLFTVGCAGLDLGWYYMNVSRLQNAADAAALAGANKLIEDEEHFANYKTAILINNDDSKFKDCKIITEKNIIQLGNEVALMYANDNLSDGTESPSNNKFTDSWTKNETTFSTNLFSADTTENNSEQLVGDLYYKVEINGKAGHLFQIFENMSENNIKVSAVSQLVYKTSSDDAGAGEPLPPEIEEELPKLSAKYVINGNWELEAARARGTWKAPTENLDNYYIKNARDNFYAKDKVWLNYNSTTNLYTEGNFYRSAEVDVDPGKGKTRTTNTTGVRNPDSLNLGFRQDIIRVLPGGLEVQNGKVVKVGTLKEIVFEKDWDIRQDTPYNRKTEVKYINQNNQQTYWQDSCDFRTHNIFNFNTPFEVRADKVTDENPYDILWTRIESEAFIPLKMLGITDKNGHTQFKSVRQIIININSDNTLTTDGKFKYRPIVFFYDGPEKIDMNSNARTPRPIILNLNANFRGIIFAPTVPVIINPNGYKFYGFIVAKQYRKLSTSGGHRVKHAKSNEMYVNDYGEVLSEPLSITKCGTYDTFNIADFGDYNYEVSEESQNNLFTP